LEKNTARWEKADANRKQGPRIPNTKEPCRGCTKKKKNNTIRWTKKKNETPRKSRTNHPKLARGNRTRVLNCGKKGGIARGVGGHGEKTQEG